VLAIDPKGDLTNIALVFDDLDARPPRALGARAGGRLARWQRRCRRGEERIADLAALPPRRGRVVLTPGSEAGPPGGRH
jgi:hypothetical protein